MTACIGRTHYEGRWYPCTLPEGHPGPCRTWIEQADLENVPLLAYEPPEPE